MKKIAVIYTIIFGLLLYGGISLLNRNAIETVDMAGLNQRYMQITEKLSLLQDDSAGQNDLYNQSKNIENEFNCHIYYTDQENYEKNVRDSIKNEDIVIDFSVQNNDDQNLSGKIAFSDRRNVWNHAKTGIRRQFICICVVILIAGYLLMLWIYYLYIRPFHKLRIFADHVARGDLDAPLKIQKNNYFGAFTESFDLMREQLKEARQNEYQANVRKKEMVAELSHDMKTPLATIKATCEVLKAKIDFNRSKLKECDTESDVADQFGGESSCITDALNDYDAKIDVITHKVDTIDQLIGNMFHATLEELEVLKVEPELEQSVKINDILDDIETYESVKIVNELPECLVYMDLLRLKQVIDNIFNNSFKYAKTEMEISFREEDKGIMMQIRDFGPGVAEDELAAVTKKFYRGKNAKGKDGTGLGLFLSKYFMEHMNGGFECYNDNGFVVVLYLSKG